MAVATSDGGIFSAEVSSRKEKRVQMVAYDETNLDLESGAVQQDCICDHLAICQRCDPVFSILDVIFSLYIYRCCLFASVLLAGYGT